MDFFSEEYAKLVGGRITSLSQDSAEPEIKGLIIQLPSGKKVTAWIMCDPEGNGPGFLDIQPVVNPGKSSPPAKEIQ